MARRKLSQQQQRRIRASQRQRVQKARAGDTVTTGEEGLVVAHRGRLVEVEGLDGQRRRCHFRANIGQLVVGDRVIWQPLAEDNDEGVIEALSPRKTELLRPDQYGNLKPVAANVDLMVIVYAPLPAPSTQLLDRYLVAAELSGITPLLLLNKADLLDEVLREQLEEIATLYEQLGYTVLESSASSAEGVTTLRQHLARHTSVLVGQSGVGKSSLINTLLPGLTLETAEVSSNSGLGQHTTTTARLFHLPEGGDLIDSPGIREFGLWHISREQLLSGYPELAEAATRCRFRNCRHEQEPGCALHEGVENGTLDPERVDNFFRIAETLDANVQDRYRS